MNRHQILATVAGLVSSLGAGGALAQECVMRLEWENRNRHVFGSISAECGPCRSLRILPGTPRIPLSHSPPWGNWGVVSVHSKEARDGMQFKGWRIGPAPTPACSDEFENIEDYPEWNSCTSGEDSRYRAPNSQFYNHNEGTEQYSADVQKYAETEVRFRNTCPYYWNDDGRIDVGGCGLERRVSYEESITLFELDPGPGDREVTTLGYRDSFSVGVSCDGWGCESGATSWQKSEGSRVASAEVRLVVVGGEWIDPDGVCSVESPE